MSDRVTGEVTVVVDGRASRVPAGASVAAAILSLDPTPAFRRSTTGEPRGPLCGMGICHECRVEIDGVGQRRACLVAVRDGMVVETTRGVGCGVWGTRHPGHPEAGTPHPTPHTPQPYDLAIIGAGPAGIAAATRVAERGARVVLLDESAEVGGQIWRHRRGERAASVEARRWIDRLERSGATVLRGASVVDVRDDDASSGFVVVAEREGVACGVHARSIVVATGARERFLPFPGWTLPGVVGVGGATALLESGAPFAGKRVVVAGGGPLLLPVAASLASHGARVLLVAEQAPRRAVAGFALGLWRAPRNLIDAARYRAAFARAPYRTGTWVTAARGDGRVEEVDVTDGRATRTIRCDVLCAAHGLVPSTELARLLGCATGDDGAVIVDDAQRTSRAGVYCAGEPTGVGGAALAIVEGEIAGLCATADAKDAAPTHALRELRELRARRARLRAAAAAMERAFAPRAELRTLAAPDTIVCRCEDVARGAIDPAWSARQAKLYTRAGMGPCQGRVCGAALRFMYGWRDSDTVRVPAEPALLSTLLQLAEPRTASGGGGATATTTPTLDRGA